MKAGSLFSGIGGLVDSLGIIDTVAGATHPLKVSDVVVSTSQVSPIVSTTRAAGTASPAFRRPTSGDFDTLVQRSICRLAPLPRGVLRAELIALDRWARLDTVPPHHVKDHLLSESDERRYLCLGESVGVQSSHALDQFWGVNLGSGSASHDLIIRYPIPVNNYEEAT